MSTIHYLYIIELHDSSNYIIILLYWYQADQMATESRAAVGTNDLLIWRYKQKETSCVGVARVPRPRCHTRPTLNIQGSQLQGHWPKLSISHVCGIMVHACA